MCDFRVGNGYDVHQLADGLPLWLGGIEIPHSKGCVAHSDGDVVIHAICDALLGAVAMGDIGLHFPDNSGDYKGIDSKVLLCRTVEIIADHGYRVGNVDATIAMQAPKLRPYIDTMREVLAQVMGVSKDCVSVKATTTEKLGFVGTEQGVEAYASALLIRKAAK